MKYVLLTICLVLNISLLAQPEWETIAIPMSDGESLAADVYLPNEEGTFPVILIQTPYNKNLYHLGLPLGVGWNQADSEYAFVILDWRCHFESLGACIPDADHGQDGYDAVEWIADQEWCTGKIGTYGPSALATVQYQTAALQPPHLTCCVPEVGAPKQAYERFYPGGAAHLELIEQLGVLFGAYDIYAAFPYDNFVWNITSQATTYAPDIQVPMLVVGGWYDLNCDATFETFAELQESAASGDDCRLLMGPWVHGGSGFAYVGSEQQGELSYPEAANYGAFTAMDFFDYYLLEEDNGWETQPTIEYFQTGSEQWRTSDVWPPMGSEVMPLYFQGDQSIALSAPNTESTFGYSYDPADPSPTVGGQVLSLPQGPFDLAPEVESRDDILLFSYDVQQPLEIAGTPTVHLYVSSDQLDTDFTVRLSDVFPDGSSYMLSSDIQRMRFLNGFSEDDEQLLTPGAIYAVELELPPLAYTWQQGHQLRVLISSSNYPHYSRNMNNGETMYPDNHLDSLYNPIVAQNSVFVGPSNPSRIELPIVNGFDLVEDWSGRSEILLFPNPAVDFIKIEGLEGQVNYEITSSMGQLMDKGTARANNELEVDHLPNGEYLITFNTRNGLVSRPFIKL